MGKAVGEMTMVEVAEQLERVTSWIEVERSKEREARKQYDAVAAQVEGSIAQIKAFAQQLLEHQNRKMSSFNGLLGRDEPAKMNGSAKGMKSSSPSSRPQANPDGVKNLADAILAIWSLDKYNESLTTEEISEALPDTGYRSNAAPASLRSSINQALAKLCRTAKVIRYRSDGSRISPRDNKSRARKYISALKAPESDIE